MKNSLFFSVATRGMKANLNLEIPFILASSVMGGLFYIMLALVGNEYVQTRHGSLPMIIMFGVVLCGLLTAVFVLYANRFLIKNRNKELALYGILGLEKRHVARVLGIENAIRYLFVTVLSITGGQLLGLLAFVGLNRLTGDLSAGMGEYGFDPKNAVVTALFLLGLFILLHILNVVKVRMVNPIQLMSSGSRAEGEPKNNYLSLITGLVMMGAGYWIALTTKGTLDSLMMFFVAVLLVIGGTYALFKSLSIFILKAQKRNRHSFYRPTNFISVSGMLYRMRANAMGLASVCVLITGIMIAAAAGLSIYRGMEAMIANEIKHDFSMQGWTMDGTASEAEIREELSRLSAIVQKTEDTDNRIETIVTGYNLFFGIVMHDNELLAMVTENQVGRSIADAVFLSAMTVSDYNATNGTNLSLQPDEIYMTANNDTLKEKTSLVLSGKEYTVKPLDDTISSTIAIDMYTILVPDFSMMQELSKDYAMMNPQTNEILPPTYSLIVDWDMAKVNDGYTSRMQDVLAEEGIQAPRSEAEMRDGLYQINGSFVFIGLLVSLMFLTGTALITYYKQITEGYEDRRNFQIMKQVGLPDELIRKTTNRQLIWLFTLPLAIALIHTAVGSKILFRLLGLFGIRDWRFYFTTLGIAVGIIALVYFIVYKFTSREYYRIVAE